MKSIEPVFILAGQSNMAGRCNILALPKNIVPATTPTTSTSGSVHVNFQICYDLDQNFGPGCSSNGSFLPLQGQPSPGLGMDIFGPEMALANTLNPRLQEMGIQRAYFIKFAMGSTNLHHNWNPSNSIVDGEMDEIGYYKVFVKFCRDALATLNENNNKDDDDNDNSKNDVEHCLWGMFWLQGESDSSKARFANAYITNFKHFIETFRHDIKAPNLPAVVSPILWRSGKKVRVINEALKKAADSDVEYCTCIEPLNPHEFDLQGEDAGNCAGHLTVEGLCEIGRRFGEAIALPPANMSDYC